MATIAEELDSGAQAVDIDTRMAWANTRGPVPGFPAQLQGREAQRLTRMGRR